MNKLAEFDYFAVEFDKRAKLVQTSQVNALLDYVETAGLSDLLIMSHGWNNDEKEAQDLYKSFFTQVQSELKTNAPGSLAGRRFAVLGIFWPSKKFADAELIPGGAANLGANPEAELLAQLDSLQGFFDHKQASVKLKRARELAVKLESDPLAINDFADVVRALPSKGDANEEDASDTFFRLLAPELVQKLSRPQMLMPGNVSRGGAAGFDPSLGGAAGFDPFGGVMAAARKILNFTTYYQMKQRAGTVGKDGLAPLLDQLAQKNPQLNLHLIGHSFGGRLVTAAAQALANTNNTLKTMTLLQAAFSHNGFASKFDGRHDGFFRSVLTRKKVAGPILVTYSEHDLAVGIAYPIASQIAGDNAAALGDAENPYGGIGRNGAQHTPEADNTFALESQTFAYAFKGAKLYNLNGNHVIKGHSDIAKKEIAHALLSAMAN